MNTNLLNEAISLTCDLIRCPSISPKDEGAQAVLIQRLRNSGFTIHPVLKKGVPGFWAEIGTQGPLFAFAGHTDVVPPGNEAHWSAPPFSPVIKEGKLYGRGSADMKGPIAAFIVGLEHYLQTLPNKRPEHFRIGLLIAGDEELTENHSTLDVLEWLRDNQRPIDYCIVGEPTSANQLGDTVRVGRRGSLYGFLQVRGVQGHSAYPHLAKNPIQLSFEILQQIGALTWEQNDPEFPNTTLEYTKIQSGTGATNVIPGHLEAWFNLRFTPEWPQDRIKQRIEAILKTLPLPHSIQWTCGAEPFLTQKGMLRDLIQSTIQKHLGVTPNLNTGGGTSDARFIAPTGAQVVEFSLRGGTSHQIDEWIYTQDLHDCAVFYQRFLEELSEKISS